MGIMLPPVEHNSRSLRMIDRSGNYTGYTWEMERRFRVCFMYIILLVFEIFDTHKSDICKKIEKNFPFQMVFFVRYI